MDETFFQYTRMITEDRWRSFLENMPKETIAKETENLCHAALLSKNAGYASAFLVALSDKTNRALLPEQCAMLKATMDRANSVADRGGWQAIHTEQTEQDVENSFPKGIYPECIERYLNSVADANQTAVEMPFSAALAAFALSLQGRYKVAYPSGNGHTEHLCLYMAIIADSSERKSPTFTSVIRQPFNKWRKERQVAYKEKLSEYKAKRKIIENQLISLQKQCKGAEVDPKIQEDIIRLQKEIDELPKPVSPHFLLDDTTPEALGKRMVETGESAGVFSDEGCFLETLAGRYADGAANIDLVLKAYSGEYTTVNRITREDFALERPLLSICLGLQPDLFDKFAGNSTLRNRGLVARFIFCRPAEMAGSRSVWNKSKVDLKSYAAYESLLCRFLNTPQAEPENIPIIQWETTAANIMLEYLQTIENAQQKGAIMESEKAYAGKSAGVAVRIAGILHMLWTEDGQQHITKETAYRAVQLHKYFFVEKLRDMQQTENEEQKQAEKVKRRLYILTVQKCKACIGVREAYMKMKGNFGLTSISVFDSVLEVLESENAVEIIQNGRKRMIYISPFLNVPGNQPTVPTLEEK